MSPFYSLSSFLVNGQVKDERWVAWCDEWAEWIMNDLPKTREGGFQHSKSDCSDGADVTRGKRELDGLLHS